MKHEHFNWKEHGFVGHLAEPEGGSEKAVIVIMGGEQSLLPGIKFAERHVVIGAGSVVTKDIPSWSLAAGNPCRVIHKITEEDKRKLFHDEEIDEEAWNMICASWSNSDE